MSRSGKLLVVAVFLISALAVVSHRTYARFSGTTSSTTSQLSAAALPATPRSKTVEFFAGQRTGSTGDADATKHDFAATTFQLAETNADVVDAYVEVGAEIAGTTNAAYGSANLYFDACVPACAPTTAAFATTGSLGADTGENQYVRLRASVTAEDVIAAYTGGNASRSFTVGYCFSVAATCSGAATASQIYAATAKLVLTYTYDNTSATQTNTVLYPLESAAGVGSKSAIQGPCTMDSNCPKFSYNAVIPEIGTQLSQWFDIHTELEQNGITDVDVTPQVDGSASGAAGHNEAAQSNVGNWNDYKFTGLAGYANNSAQQLELGVSGASSQASALGGENVITYTNAGNAATKTKTVAYPVGEVITANNSTAKSALTGPTVYLPETGVTIKKAWFRVHASVDEVPDTSSITTKVGARAETGATTYDFEADSQYVSDDGYFIHLIPAADYAELQAATATSGKAVQLTYQYGADPGGAVTAELMITYTYTSESAGYQTTQRLFAGQQTAAPATSYTTATGAINPAIPEPTSTGAVTIRGASLLANAVNTGTALTEVVGALLSTSTCTATLTSTVQAGVERDRLKLWKDVTSIVTASDAQTYTACYKTTEASVFSGELTVTYQWVPCAAAYTPTWVTGFEHGASSATDLISGTGLFNSKSGTATFAADATARTGGYSLKATTAIGSASYLRKTIAGTPTVVVGRVYVRYSATQNGVDNPIFKVVTAAGNSAVFSIDRTDGLTSTFKASVGSASTGPAAALNTWYRIDFKLNVSANPRTLDWQVDGLAQPQSTQAVAASTISSLDVGGNALGQAATAYYDDVVLTSTAADYPIGAGGVSAVVPNLLDLANVGIGHFEISRTGFAVTTASWDLVDDVPNNTITDFIMQDNNDSSAYATVLFGDTAQACVQGVSAMAVYAADSGDTSAAGDTLIYDASNVSLGTLYSGNMGATVATYKTKIVTPASGDMSLTVLNGLKIRIGKSSSDTEEPQWQALMLEYSWS